MSEFNQTESESRNSSSELGERLAIPAEQIENERDFASTVLGTVMAVVIVTDAHGLIVRVNKAGEDVSGCSAEELHGRFIWDLAPTEDQKAARHYFERVVSGHPDPDTQEIRWYRRGTSRTLSARSSVLHDARGQVKCVIGTALDITEQRLAEEQARQRQASLTTAVRLAHELSQPLEAIATYAEAGLLQLRKRPFDSGKLANGLEKMAALVQRAGEILQDLRALR